MKKIIICLITLLMICGCKKDDKKIYTIQELDNLYNKDVKLVGNVYTYGERTDLYYLRNNHRFVRLEIDITNRTVSANIMERGTWKIIDGNVSTITESALNCRRQNLNEAFNYSIENDISTSNHNYSLDAFDNVTNIESDILEILEKYVDDEFDVSDAPRIVSLIMKEEN